MATATPDPKATPRLPTHLDLPEEDGSFVTNFREHPQSFLLTDSILPVLRALHPDGRFAIGQDSGIYLRNTEPPERGCKAPDWFYVPDVPPVLDGHFRRSYVMWQEGVAPHLVLEFASDDGSEERDRTPLSGIFWVYERGVRAPFYGIFEVGTGHLEVYRLEGGLYRPMAPDAHGRYPIERMGVSLGVWEGYFLNEVAPWLRWWDDRDRLLLTGHERAEEQRLRAEEARRRADESERIAAMERHRAEALAERLRALGIDPDEG